MTEPGTQAPAVAGWVRIEGKPKVAVQFYDGSIYVVISRPGGDLLARVNRRKVSATFKPIVDSVMYFSDEVEPE